MYSIIKFQKIKSRKNRVFTKMNNSNNKNHHKKSIAMFSIHSDPLARLGSQQAGGQNLYVRLLTEELSKIGWEVDVFTRLDNQRKKQIVQINKKSRVIRLKGGKIGYISKEELITVLPEIYNNFLSFINFKNSYSLFHGHYWDGGWIALKAHLHFHKPLVTNFHSLGLIKMQTKEKYLMNKNDSSYFKKRLNIENEIAKNSSVIISLAETEKKQLQQFYGCPEEKCEVVPGGVDLKRWDRVEKSKSREVLNLDQKSFILLYVGRLEWRKGIGTLLSAGRLLKKEIPNLKILIVGGKIFGKQKNSEDYKEYKRLLKKAKEENVEDITKFVGNISNRRLHFFCSASNVMVIPSYYEPFGLVALEGMASKMPVVASNVGGLMSIIEDAKDGFLFEPRNPLSLKEKILLIYNSQELRQKLIENAYEKVKNYSWKSMIKKIDVIYENLIIINNKKQK